MVLSYRWLIFIGIAGGLLYLLAPVLSPFLVAAVLAYMGDPLVDRLEAWKLPRSLAVVVVFIGLSLLILWLVIILIPQLERQFVVLANKLPVYLHWIQHTVLPWLGKLLGIPNMTLDLEIFKDPMGEYWSMLGGVMKDLLGSFTQSGLALLGWFVNLVLIPVVTFYLLRDWDILVAHVHELLPRRNEAVIVKLVRESDEVLGAFLRGQLLVMAALVAIYTIGLQIIGLDLALLIGVLAGTVSFVPYLGFIVGIVAAGIAALMQFQDPLFLLYVGIVFIVGQAIEGMLLTPLLVGGRIGLHPVAVIFAVLAGGQLFGFVGVLLALPVAAVVMVVLRHIHELYKQSDLYSSQSG